MSDNLHEERSTFFVADIINSP